MLSRSMQSGTSPRRRPRRLRRDPGRRLPRSLRPAYSILPHRLGDRSAQRSLSFRDLRGDRLRLHRINWRNRSANGREFWKCRRLSLRLPLSVESPLKRLSCGQPRSGRASTFPCRARRWGDALRRDWPTESSSLRPRLSLASCSGRSPQCVPLRVKFCGCPPESPACSARLISICWWSTLAALLGCASPAWSFPASTAQRPVALSAAGACWLVISPRFRWEWVTPGFSSMRMRCAGTTGSRTLFSHPKSARLLKACRPNSTEGKTTTTKDIKYHEGKHNKSVPSRERVCFAVMAVDSSHEPKIVETILSLFPVLSSMA